MAKESAGVVWDDLTEEECYLHALIQDQSGLDMAEFCHTDGSRDDGIFRAWPFQVAWWRCTDPYQVDLAARSLGKSLSIEKRMTSFPLRHPGQEAVVTAPELIHLEPIVDLIEQRFYETRLLRELLPKGRSSITHRPFMLHTLVGARIIGRIPQRDGRGVKGCVAEGTLVLTSTGHRPVETLEAGDLVLTHTGHWWPIASIQEDDAECFEVSGLSGFPLVVSEDHRFYGAENLATRKRERDLTPLGFYDVEDLIECRAYWATPAFFKTIPTPTDAADTSTMPFWHGVGRYLYYGASRRDVPANFFTAGVTPTARWCEDHFGAGADLRIPGFALSVQPEHRQALLDGFLAGRRAVTIPQQALALGVQMLAQTLDLRVHCTVRPGGWRIRVGRTKTTPMGPMLVAPVRSVTPVGTRHVYNIIPEGDDHSYVTGSVVSHNIHPLKLEQDEGQNYPHKGWIELNETLKRGFEGAEWRCIAEKQLVLTNAGWKSIEQVVVGDQVLTHKQRWRPVTDVYDNGVQECVEIRGNGHHGLVVTPGHKFYTRRSSRRNSQKVFADAVWTEVQDFEDGRHTTHWASPTDVRFPCGSSVPPMHKRDWRSPTIVEDTSCEEWLWLYGLYIAEGYGADYEHRGRRHRRVHWCVNDRECEEVVRRLRRFGFKPQMYRQGEHSVKVYISNAPCHEWLTREAGTLAHNKRLAPWVFSLTESQRQAVFDGMNYGDGSWSSKRRRWEYGTASRELALSMKLFAQSLGYTANLRQYEPKDAVIEGRVIHKRRHHVVQMTKNDDCYAVRSHVLDDGLVWAPVQGSTSVGLRKVYDLGVAEDHSYVVEGMIVSNCHGVTMGVHNDFWEKTQPDSMWTVHRITAVHRPTWSDQERTEAIAKYGGRRDDPDFRRNVYGEHGEETSALFVLPTLAKCWDDDKSSAYNTQVYKHLSITLPMVEEARRDGRAVADLLSIPIHHSDYETTWCGMDVGLTTDPSEILVFAEEHPTDVEREEQRERKKALPKPGVSRLKLICRISLKRIANPDQLELILKVIEFYRPVAFAMDRTGIGLPLWMDLQAESRKAEELADSVSDAGDRERFRERAVFLRDAQERIKGYNFSEKVTVDLDDKAEVKSDSKDPLGDAAMKRLVLEQATEYVRDLVGKERLWLPWDRELLQEYEGQTISYSSSNVDAFGRRRQFSKGKFHAFDAQRMAAMAHGQSAIEEIMQASPQYEDVPVITGEDLFG